MRTATLTTRSGHTWATDVNGTDEEILDYFLLVPFDVSPDPDKERFELVIRCTIDGVVYDAPVHHTSRP